MSPHRLLWRLRIGVAVSITYLAIVSSGAAGPLELRDALLLSQPSAPSLSAARARVRAADAAVDQADRFPNPNLALEVENFSGSGTYSRFGESEMTASLQQKIELGGKREARTEAARAQRGIAGTRSLIQSLDFFREVEEAWTNALADEATRKLAAEQAASMTSLARNVSRRVGAARDPLFAGAQADAQKAQSEVRLAQAESAAQSSRGLLASYVPDQSAFDLDPALLADFSLPKVGEFGPDIAILDAERIAAATRLSVAKADAIPDPEVSLGMRRFEASKDYAVVAGVAVPIPIFDANSGNIRRTSEELSAAERDLAAARLAYTRNTARLSALLAAYTGEIRRLDSDVIPKAARAVTLARDGYARGGFSYRDVTDAQRLHNEAQVQRLEALRNFNLQRAELRRLTGEHATLVSEQEKSP